MASGPPERPVVLRRFGIIKDEYATEESLDSFRNETESAGARSADSLAIAGRHPWIVFVGLAALMTVIGVLAINALFGSAEPPIGASVDATDVANSTALATSGESSTHDSRTASARAATPAPSRTAATSAPLVEAEPVIAAGTPTPPVRETLRGSEVASNVRAPIAAQASAPAATPDLLAVPIIDNRIYSAADTDVIPPRTSEMLPGPTISSWTTRTNAMELIVSETGDVEHVQLLTIPQRMPDVLVLSRAKVWKFTPAMKDGRPVRYRLLLRWEVNP